MSVLLMQYISHGYLGTCARNVICSHVAYYVTFVKGRFWGSYFGSGIVKAENKKRPETLV